jgi:hypothetical protein
MKFHVNFDSDKPDEERAKRILDDWQRRCGLPPQKIIVMALLALDADFAATTADQNAADIEDLRDMILDVRDQSAATLGGLRHLLDRVEFFLEQGPVIPTNHREPEAQEPQEEEVEAEPPREKLPDAFVASLKKGVKPGFSLDD